jgi:hypothetical protein
MFFSCPFSVIGIFFVPLSTIYPFMFSILRYLLSAYSLFLSLPYSIPPYLNCYICLYSFYSRHISPSSLITKTAILNSAIKQEQQEAKTNKRALLSLVAWSSDVRKSVSPNFSPLNEMWVKTAWDLDSSCSSGIPKNTMDTGAYVK